MVDKLRERVTNFIIEILLVCILTVASVLWTFNSAIAVQETKLNTYEKNIEQLRVENREEHRQIMDKLMEMQRGSK
jgi:cell division protein YceG involved in septum cleavage